VTGPGNAASNGSKRDLSQSRFFCNNARKGSLVCGILAFMSIGLLVGAVVLLPIILAYTGYAHWLFRGKVGHETHYH